MSDIRKSHEARKAMRLERSRKRAEKARAEIAELEQGEFGFFVNQEQKDNIDPIETELAQEFWEVLSRMEMTDSERAREERFVNKVCEALSKFGGEDPIKLLWDIDDTLGSINLDDYQFQIRPIFLPFLELIHDKYKNARHGFITDRQNWDNVENRALIDTIGKRWTLDENLLFSTARNLTEDLQMVISDYRTAVGDISEFVSGSESEEAGFQEYQRLQDKLIAKNRSAIGKAAVLRKAGLLEDDMTIVVDDGDLPLYLEDRGVHVDMSSRAMVD